jgi:hypothetical protein
VLKKRNKGISRKIFFTNEKKSYLNGHGDLRRQRLISSQDPVRHDLGAELQHLSVRQGSNGGPARRTPGVSRRRGRRARGHGTRRSVPVVDLMELVYLKKNLFRVKFSFIELNFLDFYATYSTTFVFNCPKYT